jgi:hypothetical protein
VQAAAAGVHCSNYRAFAAQQVGYMLGDAGRYPINQARTAFAVFVANRPNFQWRNQRMQN